MSLLYLRRSVKLGFRNKSLKANLERSTAKHADILLVGVFILFILMGGSLFPLFRELASLQGEKQAWEEAALHAPIEEKMDIGPIAEDIPKMIDQCAQIFKKEDMKIHSFNLERFGDGGGSQSSFVNFALVRFDLRGTWEGLRKGLEKIESLPNQAIHVQEAKLTSAGGEILLKIYFQEPDNPSKP